MILSQLEKERWPEREMTQQQMMDAGRQLQQQRQHNNPSIAQERDKKYGGGVRQWKITVTATMRHC